MDRSVKGTRWDRSLIGVTCSRQAEALAAQCPGWRQAPSAAVDVFALASARLYDEIARNDPQPFKQRLAAVAHEWACHRLGDRLGTNSRYRQVTR
jgi:hypothetical protein